MTTNADPADASARAAETPAAHKTAWAWAVATVCGAGFLKPGPGTWGSLAAAALWYIGLRCAHLTGGAAIGATALAALLVTLIGIPAASIVEREAGREDPGFVVIDEVAGQWVVLAVCPLEFWHLLLGVALFRLFDIVKPWPARQLERLHGGTGIVLDDLAAGAYGLLVMLLVRHWW
ncbi:MAG TPA: phosphatidylglycerophosphatase A [Acidobacteriaceae bacterium]|jgi:phosphatidylglycerophosphatase A|nr:phosphatidylglycerophosphatase A [Acidobacteriaceae bacterium]